MAALLLLIACDRRAATERDEPAAELGDPTAADNAADQPVTAPNADDDPPARAATLPCPATGQLVFVDVTAHRLRLCDRGTAVAEFGVALGEGGIGKTRAGDKRTPLGRYGLATPRRSSDGYFMFIPVGYPTAAQQRAGYTGSSVGIHGPPERLPELGDAVTATDWTWGCIALSHDNLLKVVGWINEHKIRTVELRAAD